MARANERHFFLLLSTLDDHVCGANKVSEWNWNLHARVCIPMNNTSQSLRRATSLKCEYSVEDRIASLISNTRLHGEARIHALLSYYSTPRRDKKDTPKPGSFHLTTTKSNQQLKKSSEVGREKMESQQASPVPRKTLPLDNLIP